MDVPQWAWFGVPIAVAAIGGLWLISGLANLIRGRPFSGLRGVMGGAGVGAIGLAASLVGLNIQTYSRLTYERPVATIEVASVDPAQKLYNVKIIREDGSGREQQCQVQGDEWIMGARVQKWKPWANILGLDSTYDLDQMSNKYFSALEANGKPITACDLSQGEPPSTQYVPAGWTQALMDFIQLSDRRFGSANYMPLADGAKYRVVMTQSGLNSEPENGIAQRAYDAPR